MCQFIETIQVLNGEVQHLALHQARLNLSREEVLNLRIHPELSEYISVPDSAMRGLHKCRILYGREISQVEYLPYHRPEIQSLKIVESDNISYKYKFANRSELKALYEQRGSCDDILIVKNGWITDSYFANVVLWDGSSWVTPKEPLLKGCMRASLIATGAIIEKDIQLDELSEYLTIRLINTLNDLKDGPEISMAAISR